MIETLNRAGLSLSEAMEREDDLDAILKALAREALIRHAMKKTGESRVIVVEMIDAAKSMDQEAVLALTDGEPTTLRDALSQYIEGLEQGNGAVGDSLPDIANELRAILDYPYPDEQEPAEVQEETTAIEDVGQSIDPSQVRLDTEAERRAYGRTT